jgi:excisionase family DNA binding protein
VRHVSPKREDVTDPTVPVGAWRFLVPAPMAGPIRKRGAVEHMARSNEARDHFSPEELAEYLNVSRTFAYSLIADPNPAIPSFKLGRLRRVRKVDVDLYIQGRLEESQAVSRSAIVPPRQLERLGFGRS